MPARPLPYHRTRPAPLGRLAACICVSAILALGLSSRALATIDNTAAASGTYNATTVTSNSVSVQVPVTPSNGALTVTKTASPKTNVAVGTVVTYTYVVTNTGNATLTNVALSESHNGSGAPPVPSNELLTNDAGITGDSTDTTPNNAVWSVLAPGDSITFTATYTVTQNDVDTKQ